GAELVSQKSGSTARCPDLRSGFRRGLNGRVDLQSERPQPNIAEVYGTPVATQNQRAFAGLGFVFRHDAMAGFPMDLFVQQDQNSVVEHRHASRRRQLFAIEPRRLESDVERLPRTRWTGYIHIRRRLAVDRAALAIWIDLFLVGVEDLNFKQTDRKSVV